LNKGVVLATAACVVGAYFAVSHYGTSLINRGPAGREIVSAEIAAVPAKKVSSLPASAETTPQLSEDEKRLEQGRQAAREGNVALAQTVFEDLMKRSPTKPEGGQAAAEMGVLYKNAGDMMSERHVLTLALAGLGEGSVRQQVVVELSRITGELVFSKKPAADSLSYAVRPGDSLAKIAGHYKITPQFIRRINYLSSDRVNVGDQLKIFQGPFDVVIEKAKFRLTVYRAGVFIREYKVGIGKQGSTPEGEWLVKVKLIDPEWNPPGPEYAASKAPDNPLGTRWIGFDGDYGVHGTIEPDSIGKAESRGCIRLLNQDVEEIYDLVVLGSKVTVKP
jgi:LysM repeat protein